MAISSNKIKVPAMVKIKLKYPQVGDDQFQKKISLKKEFQYKYDGTIKDLLEEEKQGRLSSKGEISLNPHQEFVKAFINESTPYNGLLLYHGMGSGKTCSAIGITEEYRKANKYNPNSKKIYVVASPNVQENFKLQLFNKSKLIQKNKIWYLGGCVGESLLNELKHYDFDKLSKDKISRKIEKLISKHYVFMGYEKFANRIESILKYNDNGSGISEKQSKKKAIHEMKKIFKGAMLVIDEVHNVRMSHDSDNKKVATALTYLVKTVGKMKLLFLSGTPMFNDPKEIIFLTNLLNMNDGHNNIIKNSQVFTKDGELLEKDGEKIGENILRSRLNGYVSFVRGENPFSFPFKVYPKDYQDEYSVQNFTYPRYQFNKKPISTPLGFLDLYVNYLGEEQGKGYQMMIDNIFEKYKKVENDKFESMDSFGYNILQEPLKMLNMCYPSYNGNDVEYLTGKPGMDAVMSYEENNKEYMKYDYDYYMPDNKIFKYENIGKYSSKIKTILDKVMKSKGIVLVYSQYLDAGIVPVALALEELGFRRCKHNNLLKPRQDIKTLNSKTMTYGKNMKGEFIPCAYAMITGDKFHSPNNNEELHILNSSQNKDGFHCKVVLISQAGSEGIDFKYLRQVHVMEPWYNLNRIEQVIGRAIRNYSHQDLPLKNRNSQIFLHSTYIDENTECMDMMVYRYVEKKSQKIGKVQKVLKSISVDCLLNEEQMNFSKYMNQSIDIELSNKQQIPYVVKDKAYSSICDYSEDCEYQCHNSLTNQDGIDDSSYHYKHLHNASLIKKLKSLFTKSFLYKKSEIVELLSSRNQQIENIDYALDYIVENNEYLVDRFLRKGKIINIKDLYIFQPIELEDEVASLYDLKRPITLNKSHVKKILQQNEQIIKHQASEDALPSNKKEVSLKKTSQLNTLLEEIELNLSMSVKIDESKHIPYFSEFKKVSNILQKGGINIEDKMLKSIGCEIIFNTMKLDDELLLLRYFEENQVALSENEKLLYRKMRSYIQESNGVRLYITTNLYQTDKKDTKIKMYVIENNDSGVNIVEASPLDKNKFGMDNVKSMLEIPENIKKYNIMTFMDYYVRSKKIEVKTREYTGSKKNKGALFANKSVKDRYPIINGILQTDMIYKDGKTLKFGDNPLKLTDNEWVIMLLVLAYYKSNEKIVYYLDKVLYNFNL